MCLRVMGLPILRTDGSVRGQAKECHQVSVAVERRELSRAKVGLLDPVLGNRVQDIVVSELLEELVHTVDAYATARRTRDEGLGPRANRLLDRIPVAPAFVTRLPEVEDGLVASQHRKPTVVVDYLEAETVTVVVDRRRSVSDRQGGDGLSEMDHGRTNMRRQTSMIAS